MYRLCSFFPCFGTAPSARVLSSVSESPNHNRLRFRGHFFCTAIVEIRNPITLVSIFFPAFFTRTASGAGTYTFQTTSFARIQNCSFPHASLSSVSWISNVVREACFNASLVLQKCIPYHRANNSGLSWVWDVLLKSWPNGLASRRKSTQVCRTRTCVRTCDGWPNGFASRLASSRKSQRVANFPHIQLTFDQLVSTCLGYEFEFDQSHRKSIQVGGQTKRKVNASREFKPNCGSIWPGLETRTRSRKTFNLPGCGLTN